MKMVAHPAYGNNFKQIVPWQAFYKFHASFAVNIGKNLLALITGRTVHKMIIAAAVSNLLP
jgi:hypothetical protein